MYITVIGGGNSTAIFATQAKLAGHEVAVLTRKPEKWAKDNVLGFRNDDPTYLEGKKDFTAKVDLITSDYGLCIPQSDMIFIAGVPIHFNEEILEKLKPHMKLERENPVLIGSICGYGGFNWLVSKVLGKGNYFIFATSTIPWTCGTVEYGRTGAVFGKKSVLKVATESGKDEKDIKKILSGILKIEKIAFLTFLAATLYPNNPSVHPPILYALFKDWDQEGGQKYEFGTAEAPEFIYCDVQKYSAECIEELNKEHVDIVKALYKQYPTDSSLEPTLFNYLNSLLDAYSDIGDKSSTYNAIRSCGPYKNHRNPYVVVPSSPDKKQKAENGTTVEKKYVIPNVEHKFFTTDLPYGLCTYKDIANLIGVKTPLMDKIIYWNQKLIKKEYLVNGELTGKHIGECILPSKMGLVKETLNKGNRN